jgi:hypothetical protein
MVHLQQMAQNMVAKPILPAVALLAHCFFRKFIAIQFLSTPFCHHLLSSLTYSPSTPLSLALHCANNLLLLFVCRRNSQSSIVCKSESRKKKYNGARNSLLLQLLIRKQQ